jgi:hypothetical protein
MARAAFAVSSFDQLPTAGSWLVISEPFTVLDFAVQWVILETPSENRRSVPNFPLQSVSCRSVSK